MTEKSPNRLIHESSPYLLQHARNPVDWHPWGSEALEKVVTQDKLLIISIGYAACHWCHVMEHESFEDPAVAAVMNEHFVSVKVDREERPDIDQVYMAAAYVTTGRGGWPLNVIALPDRRPLFAGTYFRKKDWLTILDYFITQYRDHRSGLEEQADEIARGMKGHFIVPSGFRADRENPDPMQLYGVLVHDLDPFNGGTAGAPKFPMPALLEYIMLHGVLYSDPRALRHLKLTLGKMASGGIYDHLGGGFSRYSVDGRWHVPHFEKMLYDNAQLVSLYAGFHIIAPGGRSRDIVEETIGFIARELQSPQGLFLSSIDADSDGREGAFYAWTEQEILSRLGSDAELFLEFYSCIPEGNWEDGLNVLMAAETEEQFANRKGVDPDQFARLAKECRSILHSVRSERIRPATDDKVLTCWNGLMISALVHASMAFDRPLWLEQAEKAAEIYLEVVNRYSGALWRNFKGEKLQIPAFLDDYSLLMRAFLDLYETTFMKKWLDAAEVLGKTVIKRFSTPGSLFFTLAAGDERELPLNGAELSDNVIPASNSVMAGNLMRLGYLLTEYGYTERAENMVRAMIPAMSGNPAFYAGWASLWLLIEKGIIVVNIEGENALEIRGSFYRDLLPRVIWKMEERTVPEGKANGETSIMVCHGKTCLPPIRTVAELRALLKEDLQTT